MSYQVLARKWRPKTFQQLVGQEHVSQALINGLDQDRVHHAFLFTGTRGVGKTTIARILAKCLNCEEGVSSEPCGECGSCVDVDEGRFVDMLEIDAASRTKVDDTRELLESVQYTPTRGRYKVYIIDEVHMLSASSFNALLKTLEEPPPHVKFVLATTDPQKIPVTILSRCLRFNLRRLLPDQIEPYLTSLLGSEGIEAEPEALACLARAADGSMRDGLSLLDQAIAYGGGKLTYADVETMLGIIDHEHVTAMIEALAGNDGAALLDVASELVAQSRDLESVLTRLAETLHRICLVQCVPAYQDLERSDWDAIRKLADILSAEDAQLFYQIAIKGGAELGMAPDPRTGLEMTLLRMLAFRPAQQDGQTGGGVSSDRAHSASPPVPKANEQAERIRASRAAPGSREAAAVAVPTAQAAPDLFADDSDWLSIQAALKLKGQARELARNVQLKSRGEDHWEFVIAPSLKHLGSASCIDRLSDAISARMGHRVHVRLAEGEEVQMLSAAGLEERQTRDRMSEAEKSIDEDPTVKSLKEQMGARVVEDSIQPLQ
jgi:DNA polymerase-3 subunit gamma/tau